jgi:hypothetical protein
MFVQQEPQIRRRSVRRGDRQEHRRRLPPTTTSQSGPAARSTPAGVDATIALPLDGSRCGMAASEVAEIEAATSLHNRVSGKAATRRLIVRAALGRSGTGPAAASLGV